MAGEVFHGCHAKLIISAAIGRLQQQVGELCDVTGQ
jgi:hypothetical protein